MEKNNFTIESGETSDLFLPIEEMEQQLKKYLEENPSDMEEKAIGVVKTLHNKGYETYFAGGSVRDFLLGKKISDIDIATSATPDEIKKIFKKVSSGGNMEKYGSIRVHKGNHEFEVTTFRIEKGYKDKRRPDKVIFTSAEKDATRRDFTINGLFYDPLSYKVIDFVDGLSDLDNKVLRFIGDPNQRIEEDNLRLLRAIRFKNKFGLKYDEETWQSVVKNADLIKNVSAERIRDELTKMLMDGSRVFSLSDISESGLLKEILPEIENLKDIEQPENFHTEGDAWNHTLLSLKVIDDNFIKETEDEFGTKIKISPTLIWAVLLHDVGKPRSQRLPEKDKVERITFHGHEKIGSEIASKVLKSLRFSNDDFEHITWLIGNHMRIINLPQMREAKQKKFFLEPWFSDLLFLHKVDTQSSLPVNLDLYNQTLKLFLEAQKQPKVDVKGILNGDDLKKIGISEGPKIGRILSKIEEEILEGKIKTKDEAFKRANDFSKES